MVIIPNTQMQCQYIFPRGERRGVKCTGKVTDGEYCCECSVKDDVIKSQLFQREVPQQVPQQEQLNVTLISNGLYHGLYHEISYDLLIKQEGNDFKCLGLYDAKTGQMRPLTAEKIQICQKYKIGVNT